MEEEEFRLQRGSRAFSIIHPNLCAIGLEKNDKLTGCLAESGLLLQSSPLKHASSHIEAIKCGPFDILRELSSTGPHIGRLVCRGLAGA